jgi:Fe-S-cluster containining protein
MTFEAAETDEIFTCTTCGACCCGFGGTILQTDDILRISEFLGIPEKRFIDEFCDARGRRVYPAQRPDGFCMFHKDGLCGIHPVKPSMCRRWPFIESVLVDVQNWRSMATVCPGMRVDVPDDVIREKVTREIEKGRIEAAKFRSEAR